MVMRTRWLDEKQPIKTIIFSSDCLANEECELEIEIHKLRNYKKRHFLALYYHVHLLKIKVLDVQNSD